MSEENEEYAIKIISELLNDTKIDEKKKSKGKSKILKVDDIIFYSWNTHKFKCADENENLEKLKEIFKDADFIAFQEIPAGVGIKRINSFLETLGKEDWNMIITKPSGINNKIKDATTRSNKEVHVIYYKKKNGWEYVKSLDTDEKFDYTPEIMIFENTKLDILKNCQFYLTSIHFPPTSRKDDLILHCKEFIPGYITVKYNSKNEQKLRNKKNEYDIIMGDFNTTPDKITLCGFRDFSNTTIKTSSGLQSYDHFIGSDNISKDFSIARLICDFDPQNEHSDHKIIKLILQKQSSI